MSVPSFVDIREKQVCNIINNSYAYIAIFHIDYQLCHKIYLQVHRVVPTFQSDNNLSMFGVGNILRCKKYVPLGLFTYYGF